MKKSDMVQHVKDVIASRTCEEISLTDSEAELILEDLLKLGMKPVRLPEDYCQAILTVYYAGYTLNQWEEDVQKDEKVMEAYKKRMDFQALTPEERKIRRGKAIRKLNGKV